MQNFWLTRLRLEKVIYSSRINIALVDAEESKTYTSFVKKAGEALYAPIKEVASQDIDRFILLAKASTTPALITAISVIVEEFSFDALDVLPFLIWAGQQGGQAALDKLQIEGNFVLKNKELVNYFSDHQKLLIQTVDETTKKWIAGKIQEGKDNLLTPQQIADSLISEGKKISKERAKMIAITETASAMTKVEIEAAMRYGITQKIWRTSRDDGVDPICLDLEGKIADIDGLFQGEFDGPPAHPNCRCFIEEVVPENWEMPSKVWLGQ